MPPSTWDRRWTDPARHGGEGRRDLLGLRRRSGGSGWGTWTLTLIGAGPLISRRPGRVLAAKRESGERALEEPFVGQHLDDAKEFAADAASRGRCVACLIGQMEACAGTSVCEARAVGGARAWCPAAVPAWVTPMFSDRAAR